METYRYALAVTSQFYYCGLPLRLDSYSNCGFKCLYCFSLARGGNRGEDRPKIADASALERRLAEANESPDSVLKELLSHRQPIHFGGMSDPFPAAETHFQVTLDMLEVLAAHRYPTILSTKSALFASDQYLDVLKSGRFLIQVSISSLDEDLSRAVELGTAGPKALLNGAALAVREGIPVACRIQPLLPTREGDAFDVIRACADIGVGHVAVEHLKLPLERKWGGTQRLSEFLELDLLDHFSRATRVGREWILPVDERMPEIIGLRDEAHKQGLTFGAADNDLLLLSDGNCCCSGADLVSGFEDYFRYTYTEAVRRGHSQNEVTLSALDGVWYPRRSIGEFVNSRSRLANGAGIKDYIHANWNGSPNGNSPMSLHGVVDTNEHDADGNKVYALTDGMRRLVPTPKKP